MIPEKAESQKQPEKSKNFVRKKQNLLSFKVRSVKFARFSTDKWHRQGWKSKRAKSPFSEELVNKCYVAGSARATAFRARGRKGELAPSSPGPQPPSVSGRQPYQFSGLVRRPVFAERWSHRRPTASINSTAAASTADVAYWIGAESAAAAAGAENTAAAQSAGKRPTRPHSRTGQCCARWDAARPWLHQSRWPLQHQFSPRFE